MVRTTGANGTELVINTDIEDTDPGSGENNEQGCCDILSESVLPELGDIKL